jgi:hypothetical protein
MRMSHFDGITFPLSRHPLAPSIGTPHGHCSCDQAVVAGVSSRCRTACVSRRVISHARSCECPGPDLLNGHPVVGWVSDAEFGVITVGSSSCPAVASELHVLDDDEVRVGFGSSPHDLCTADMAATTHVYELPSSVTGRPVTVIVQFAESETEYLLELE